MQYEKKIRDTFGDDVEVSVGVQTSDSTVLLEFAEDGSAQMIYTPKQARRLARALKHAANVAEGKPAKARKPKATIFRDGDGDYWHLSPNGFYGIDGPSDNAHRTLDSVIDAYGTWGGE